MGISKDATTSDVDAGANPSWTHTPGTGISLITISASSSGGTVSAATYGGIACTLADNGTSGTCRGGLFYLNNPSQGNQTATVTAAAQAYAVCTSWKGTHASSPVGTASESTGSAGSSSIVLAGRAGGIIIDTIAITHNPGAVTMGADQIAIIQNEGAPELLSSYEVCTDASNHTMSWTWEWAKDRVHHAMAIYPASGGSSIIIMLKQMQDFMRELKLGRLNPQTLQRRWREALLPI